MANSNVRFYKLATLPNFEAKHKGIFVHVTGIMDKNVGKELWMTPPDKDGGNVGRIDLVKWLVKRRIESIESGLWFGGENGWELLSNDTTSGAIDAAIVAKIQGLDVEGYAQATISGSTLTILGIQEVDGEISNDSSKDVNIAIDGTYNESTNKIATQSTVTTAIGTLNVDTIQAVDKETSGNITTLTFKGVKEANGKIEQGTGAETLTVGDAKLKIQIGSSAATNVFSANATEDSTIQLDGFVFRKDKNNVISVITPTAVTSSNRLVTEQDIASLGGAMHYKGALTGAQDGDGAWPTTVKAGDVYIVTTSFTHSGESNPFEVGDMIVFNTDGDNSKYTVVQSNLTLGTGAGKVAANTESLTENNIVVATDTGIKTIGISVDNLTDTTTNNKRDLSIANGDADGDFHHDVTITDDFTVIGKDFTKTINISSTNRSIEIAKNGETGVVVDLVWNTIMEP